MPANTEQGPISGGDPRRDDDLLLDQAMLDALIQEAQGADSDLAGVASEPESVALSLSQADIDARNFTGRIHVRYDNGCLVISAEQPPPPRAYVTVDRDGNVEGYRPPSPPTRVGTGRGRRERPPSPGAAAVSPPPLKRRSRTARS